MVDESTTKDAEALLGEAVLLRARGKRRDAIAKCLEALKLQPENSDGFEILGDLYAQGNLAEAAVEAYQRALELNPSKVSLELKIGRAALMKDRFNLQQQSVRELMESAGKEKKRSPAVAGLLSLILPGLGQIYNHQQIKGLAILLVCIFFSMAGVAAAFGMLVKQRPSMAGLDLFLLFELLFTPPALWWTLLVTALYIYSVVDAALIATRTKAEKAGII